MEKHVEMKFLMTLTGGLSLFIIYQFIYKYLWSTRIAAAPLFPNLRRFPHGRRFKQWTGDDSKALMKV
jgi:hypothetical protein